VNPKVKGNAQAAALPPLKGNSS